MAVNQTRQIQCSQTPTMHSINMYRFNNKSTRSVSESQQTDPTVMIQNSIHNNNFPKFSHIKFAAPTQSFEKSNSEQDTHSAHSIPNKYTNVAWS
eukprot:414486_1